MNRRTRLLTSLLLLTVLLGVPMLLTWRAVRQERLNSKLIAAIKHNDKKGVFWSLAHGADANARESVHANLSFLEAFLHFLHRQKHERDLSATALLIAIEQPCDRAIVQALLDRGANVNEMDKEGRTVVWIARDSEKPDVVALLLRYGADANQPQPGGVGRTLLMEAAGWGTEDEIALLLHAGAHTEARDTAGETALLYALDHGPVENVRALVKGHADVNVRDAEGKTALALAKECLNRRMVTSFNHGSSEEERKEDWGEIVHLLKQAGAKE